ncbi:hypothetical protein EMCRGX_G004262 [Ephydatia muelleri]|eukprot:Em0007g257a
MSGFMGQLGKHPAVLPVFVITIAGAVFAGSAIFRASNKYTDVSFRRSSNPHPWLNVGEKENRKFIQVNDYSKLKERPKID